MEWLLIILGICALIALGARLHQDFISLDSEDSPVFPCIIEVSNKVYFQDYKLISPMDGFYPDMSYKEDLAYVFDTKESYANALHLLREHGWTQTKWKCVPKTVLPS